MNKGISLHLFLLLIVTVSVSAQTLPARTASAPAVPLNLSLPKKVMAEKVLGTEQDKTADLSTDQTELSEVGSRKTEERGALRLPYGTGFEDRQQGMAIGGFFRGGMGRRK